MITSVKNSVFSFTNKSLPAPSKLTSGSELVYGIWNTTAGSNSRPSSAGTSAGSYSLADDPENVLDNDKHTEYSNYGTCSLLYGSQIVECGKNTGLYLSLLRGPSLLVAFRICTPPLYVERDPLTLTIEGSNVSSSMLTYGSSWILIYNGSSGLDIDPGRKQCGVTQWLSSNSIWYSSYRILITSKRDQGNYVQYSEVELLGY